MIDTNGLFLGVKRFWRFYLPSGLSVNTELTSTFSLKPSQFSDPSESIAHGIGI